MYHLQRNEMYRLGDNAPKSYVVHRRLTFIECLHSEFTVPYSGEMTLHKSGERPEQDLSPGHKISKIAVNNQRVRSEIHRCGVISRKHSVNPVFSA